MPSNFEATVQSYHAAEKLLQAGRARAIGVSNFGPDHLKQLLKYSGTIPAVNQIELHPFFTHKATREAHARLGILIEAWSPLSNSVRKFGNARNSKDPLTSATITAIAEKHSKTPAQVVLRWHIQHGICAIPKSFRAEHIAENFHVFDFEITPEEVAAIDRLDTGARSGPDPNVVNASTFRIRIEDPEAA